MGTAIRWKVVSSRPYRWGKSRLMKPGQIFSAVAEDIPADFMPMIIPLDPYPGPAPDTVKMTRTAPTHEAVPWEQPEVVEKPVTYRIKARGDYFDIVDSKGKKINENKLSKEEAQDLLNKLQA